MKKLTKKQELEMLMKELHAARKLRDLYDKFKLNTNFEVANELNNAETEYDIIRSENQRKLK